MFKYLFLATSLFAHEDVSRLSEALGHMIGKNLSLPVDTEALAKGLTEEQEGKPSPMSEEECLAALQEFHAKAMEQLGAQNFQAAVEFLEKNGKRGGVVSLADGKIQYEIKRQGEGEKVKDYNTPLIHIKGHFLNGTPIPAVDQVIDLQETMPGLAQAIVGMQTQEVRTVYIHPDLSYAPQEDLPPQALAILEVEVLQANATPPPQDLLFE